MYQATTRDIEVQVTPRYLSERSSPENGDYFWAYTIEITNRGGAAVQLKTRNWKITDAHGKMQEVRGAGVVGESRPWSRASCSNTPAACRCRRRPDS